MSEDQKLEMLAESIFSGIIKSKNKDSDEDSDEEKDEESEESEEKDDKDSEKDEESDEDDDKDEEKDEDSEEKDEDDESGEKTSSAKDKSPAKSKLKALQTQYNDLLIDLFDKFSVECIEAALDESEASFGENIEDILTDALERLKSKIMEELGVESRTGIEAEGGYEEIEIGGNEDEEMTDDENRIPPAAMGSFDPDAAKGKFPMEINI